MSAVLIDTSVPLHAEGGPGEPGDGCRRVMERIGVGSIEASASVELIQEYVHVKRRRGHPLESIETRVDLLSSLFRLLPFEVDHVAQMLDLLHDSPQLNTRDAIHAATAIGAGIEIIVSTDSDFDGIDALTRIDPRDRTAVDGLGT